MCGIAGAVFWTPPQGARDLARPVTAMVDALGHRGPDGHGMVTCASLAVDGISVVLGHTRLAILDLSDRGAQPMRSAAMPIWIVFNGEIYNFADVRVDLERRGRRFQSHTDTEVILQGYEEWGRAIVDRLDGMFAFAIWDGRTRELIVARDRIGIKPVYFARTAAGVVFASEVRALLASGLVARAVDPVAVDEFLAYQTVAPPRTLVAGVEMLRPGHELRVHADRETTTERQYWDLLGARSTEAAGASAEDARSRVHDLLVDSAKKHLVSDVPVGVFLSGGIDSSALVALTRAAGVTPRTFAVVLPGSPHDEARFARIVAERFHADHQEIPLTERELKAAIPDAMSRVDHPTGDGFNTFVVSEAVRRAGVKVAWSGLGGDELFGGYPSFRRLRRLAAYAPAWRRSPAAIRSAAAAAVRAVGRASVASVKAAAVLESDGSFAEAFPLTRQVFAAADRDALLTPDIRRVAVQRGDTYVTALQHAMVQHPGLDVMTLVSYAELTTYTHDVLLRDTDQMSMAHGLEARVPLLDHRLCEYIMGLPESAKMPGSTPKRLLVESLDQPIPDACVNRPKQGFVLPFAAWMRGELRDFCEARLGPSGLAGRGFVQPAAVERLWTSFQAGHPRTSWSRLWVLVALECWMTENGLSA